MLELQCYSHIEPGVDYKLPDAGLLVWRDGENHDPAGPRCVSGSGNLVVFHSRVEVAAIPQVRLNLVGIFFDCRNREPASGLQQIHARANLISRDWCSVCRTNPDADTGNDDLSLHDETHANRNCAIV